MVQSQTRERVLLYPNSVIIKLRLILGLRPRLFKGWRAPVPIQSIQLLRRCSLSNIDHGFTLFYDGGTRYGRDIFLRPPPLLLGGVKQQLV